MADVDGEAAGRPAEAVPVSTGPSVSRRTFLRGTAAAAGTVATVGYAHRGGYAPIGRVEAVAPIVVGGIVVAGAVGYLAGRAITEYTTGDDVEGLENYSGADALTDEWYLRAKSMVGADDTVFTVMKNRLADAQNVAWSKAKLATVEALEAGKSKADTKADAYAQNDEFYTVLQTNLINHWNEQVNKLENAVQTYEAHSTATTGDGLKVTLNGGTDQVPASADFATTAKTLLDGSTMNVHEMTTSTGLYLYDYEWNDTYSPIEVTAFDSAGTSLAMYQITHNSTTYDAATDEADVYPRVYLWNEIQNQHASMETNIGLFVDDMYASYQQGDIEPADLIDAATFAGEMAAKSDDHFSYAAADLAALGLPMDIDGTHRIRLEDTGVEVEGLLATSDDTFTATVGTTYDPSVDVSGQVYMAYNVDTGQGTVDPADYNVGVDGGVVTMLVEPHADTEYVIKTTAGETATAVTADWTDNGDGTWSADVSAQLNENITEVDSITYHATTAGSHMTQVEEPFTILEYTDKDGNQLSEVSYESYNHQTSDVNLTKEELEKILQARDGFDEYMLTNGAGAAGASARWSVFQRLDIPLGPLGTIPGEATAGGITLGSVGAAVKTGLIGGGSPPSGGS